jgi:hypothetical protein
MSATSIFRRNHVLRSIKYFQATTATHFTLMLIKLFFRYYKLRLAARTIGDSSHFSEPIF